MKIQLVLVAFVVLLASEASAQSSAQTAIASPLGIWRGTSVCLVHPSACHDETVVYRITKMKGADSVAIDAAKIVNGVEEGMGVLSCRFVAQGAQLICALPLGVWKFRVRSDSLI